MTTSQYDFDLTRNKIIASVLRKLNALPYGQNPSNEQIAQVSDALNIFVKNLAGKGKQIWLNDWITLPFHASSIVLGTDGFDYECIRQHTSSSDNQPITGTQWASFWKKLSTSAGAAWVTATAYTSICSYFLDNSVIGIEKAIIRQGNSRFPLTQLSTEDYMNLGNVSTIGKPNQFFFRRKEPGEIYFFPYPASVTDYVIEMFVYKYPKDFDSATDYADFLQEWLKPIIYGTAIDVAPEYFIDKETFYILKGEYKEAYNNAMGIDEETGDMQINIQITR